MFWYLTKGILKIYQGYWPLKGDYSGYLGGSSLITWALENRVFSLVGGRRKSQRLKVWEGLCTFAGLTMKRKMWWGTQAAEGVRGSDNSRKGNGVLGMELSSTNNLKRSQPGWCLDLSFVTRILQQSPRPCRAVPGLLT